MARYLVTGIAGFIGSSIARALVLRGYQVTGIDNLSTGSMTNLYPLSHAIRFYQGDIRDQGLLNRACEGVDYIFHEAAVASVQKSIEDPSGTESVNLAATLSLINAAVANRTKRIIFASSASIYGATSGTPVAESAAPNPLSPYAYHKLAAEHALKDAFIRHQLETVSLRYFNVFGPRQSASTHYSGLIARLIALMLFPDSKVRPEIYGDGEQARDFVYIEDVVAANLAAAAAPADKVAGKVFNIASGSLHSVNQVAEIIANRVGYFAGITHVSGRSGGIRKSVADISLAGKLLGYHPTTDLAQGLGKTIDWYRCQGSNRLARSNGHVSSSIDALRRREREGLVEDLTEAVQCGNFGVLFQPIVSLKDGRLSGAEALLRWQNRGKNVPASRFVALAEETGLIHKMGAWCIRHACAMIGEVSHKLDPDFRLAVNVSPSQLESDDLHRAISGALRQENISARNLEIEITERVCIHHWTKVSKALDCIHQDGVSIALDDFGAGHSNMESLCRLKVNRIKIHRSITMVSSAQLPVFHGIVAMAGNLDISVVAEGLETKRQLERAKAAGCDEAQGFIIAKPSTTLELVRLAEANSVLI